MKLPKPCYQYLAGPAPNQPFPPLPPFPKSIESLIWSLCLWQRFALVLIIYIIHVPKQSMYGIFTYIWLIFMVNVGNILYMDSMGLIHLFPKNFHENPPLYEGLSITLLGTWPGLGSATSAAESAPSVVLEPLLRILVAQWCSATLSAQDLKNIKSQTWTYFSPYGGLNKMKTICLNLVEKEWHLV